MKNKYFWIFYSFLILLIFQTACQGIVIQYEGNVEREKLEKFLKTADVISVEKGQGRRSEKWDISLDDGKTQKKGAFKLLDRSWTNISGGNSYKYVLAAYELNKILGLDLVPPTVERKIDGIKGSLMLFVEQPFVSDNDRLQKGLEPPNPEEFDKAMAEVIIFEHLVFFPCICNQRDLDNILIQTDQEWKIWMVDLDEAFVPAKKLIPDCEINSCTKELLKKILDLNENVVKKRLKSYLSKDQLFALMVRRDLIVEKIEELVEEKGEEAILIEGN